MTTAAAPGELDPVRDLLDRLERLVAQLDRLAAGPARELARAFLDQLERGVERTGLKAGDAWS